jgi:hypothetical protein
MLIGAHASASEELQFQLEDLVVAYRKAKVDLYYSTDAPLIALAEYEGRLLENLQSLLELINSDDDKWIAKAKFVGGWTLATKTCWPDRDEFLDKHGDGFKLSSPSEAWEHSCALYREKRLREMPEKPQAEFRIMAKCSIDFHVLSTLWILKVGCKYDRMLGKNSYGNRLRRKRNGDINELSLGSFVPYLNPFRAWRDKGIGSIRKALDDGKKVIAITADVSSFYHELNPGFMLDSRFVGDVLGLDFSDLEAKLNRLFIKALLAWAKRTPLKRGIPVGLPAAAVVANMAMVEFDRLVEREVVPLYYGRYVDDVLLVMEDSGNIRSGSELWDWFIVRSSEKLSRGSTREGKNGIRYAPSYLRDGDQASFIVFANSKNKIFKLHGEPGRALIEVIARQIEARASEWRGLPKLGRTASQVGTDILTATQEDGDEADSLRKTEAVTARRAEFAMKLRDLGAYERDLHPEEWREHRVAFFQAAIQYVLVLPNFFELAIYLPRLVMLAVACEEFGILRQIIVAVGKIIDGVQESCCFKIKALEDEDNAKFQEVGIVYWKSHLSILIRERIACAIPHRLTRAGKRAWEEFVERLPGDLLDVTESWLQKDINSIQMKLWCRDLAFVPFRSIGLPVEMISRRSIPTRNCSLECNGVEKFLPDEVVEGCNKIANWIKVPNSSVGLLFATRPFSLPELYLIGRDAYSPKGRLETEAVILALRGFRPNVNSPRTDNHGVIHVECNKPPGAVAIAVASWETREKSWVSAATKVPDLSVERYGRLNQMLDELISRPHGARYVVLPELALPARWFIRIARKLMERDISLIAGVEYLHGGKSRVRQQVWASLVHTGFGFPSIVVCRQDKQRPALHEEQELQRIAGLSLKPEKTWSVPQIIQHGDFRFTSLVCSELTNIDYRAALRGKIDALFVPEWNKDTETFNSLVESAALDIHAFIVQCNNRKYGDSRIRAPYKESWERDLLRVKGGISDYIVIGQIDVDALRRFQSSHQSPSMPFKPVPDGFQISRERWTLPS